MVSSSKAERISRRLHPSFVALKSFLFSWHGFFSAELANLVILFGAVYLFYKVFLFHKLKLWSYWLGILLYRKFVAGNFCTNEKRLNGSMVVITGADSGIGKAVARELTKRGAHLILASKDLQKGEETKEELMSIKGSCEVRHCDLSSLESVRTFANGLIAHKYHLSMIINAAGELMPSEDTTVDGIDHQMSVNHLGHFLLTNMLLPWLKEGSQARIVNVSSSSHVDGEVLTSDSSSKWQSYCNSKLATVLFTKELARRMKNSGVEVFCANPGMASTPLYRHILPEFVYVYLLRFLIPSAHEAAQTIIHCATEADSKDHYYFSECQAGWPSKDASDEDLAKKFWTESERLVGL